MTGHNQRSIRDARDRFGDVVHDARDGRRTVITSHGRPAAAVVSLHDLERLERLDGLAAYADWTKAGRPVTGRTLDEHARELGIDLAQTEHGRAA